MKKLLLFTAIAAFAFSTAHSQEIRFGVKAGANFANMSVKPDDGISLDGRTSFHIGGLVEIPISEKFSVQPELLYSSVGAKYKDNDPFFGDMELTYKLSYISIPVMAKYYVVDGLALEAGPQFGFLASAKGEVEIGGESASEDIKDQFKSLDIGLGIGASYRLDMGVFFGARYALGLSNIADDTDDDVKVKNNVLQISVGYTF
ncbi:MAG TPA: porin family protein [Xanthomarina sp.]|nr:porin family protein [Xanthomarina sp.]